jgi:hypothetical protein
MPSSVAAVRRDNRKEELTEIKKSPLHPKVDEEISEFERARSLSKTWSMPQDWFFRVSSIENPYHILIELGEDFVDGPSCQGCDFLLWSSEIRTPDENEAVYSQINQFSESIDTVRRWPIDSELVGKITGYKIVS